MIFKALCLGLLAVAWAGASLNMIADPIVVLSGSIRWGLRLQP